MKGEKAFSDSLHFSNFEFQFCFKKEASFENNRRHKGVGQNPPGTVILGRLRPYFFLPPLLPEKRKSGRPQE